MTKNKVEIPDSFPSKFKRGTLGYVFDQERGIEQWYEARKARLLGVPDPTPPTGSLQTIAEFLRDVVHDIRHGLATDSDEGDAIIVAACTRMEKYASVLHALTNNKKARPQKRKADPIRYYGEQTWHWIYTGDDNKWPEGFPKAGRIELGTNAGYGLRQDERHARHLLRKKMGVKRLPKGLRVFPSNDRLYRG